MSLRSTASILVLLSVQEAGNARVDLCASIVTIALSATCIYGYNYVWQIM